MSIIEKALEKLDTAVEEGATASARVGKEATGPRHPPAGPAEDVPVEEPPGVLARGAAGGAEPDPDGARPDAGAIHRPARRERAPDSLSRANSGPSRERAPEVSTPADLPQREPSLGDLDDIKDEPSPDGVDPRRTRQFVELDYAALRTAGIITPDTLQGTTAEQMRIIKRPLLLKANSAGDPAVPTNIVQITSALPGEGKTFTAINLAMSIAMELDRTVLLVDADTARSDVARIFGIQSEDGLSDYLVERDRPLSEYLVRTDIEKLSVLPAGRHYPNVTELFSSEDMQRLMSELSTRYADRVVLIDSAPLLATSGATVLSHLAGQIVLVVEAIRTPQGAVRDALTMLETIDHDNVGIVLNKSRDRSGKNYGHGYGYYFGGQK